MPAELRAEMARAASLATRPGSRPANSPTSPVPARPEKNVELKHRYVECFDAARHVYDVLLDDFEPGMATAEVRRLFDELKRTWCR